jgi:hypothetical protein
MRPLCISGITCRRPPPQSPRCSARRSALRRPAPGAAWGRASVVPHCHARLALSVIHGGVCVRFPTRWHDLGADISKRISHRTPPTSTSTVYSRPATTWQGSVSCTSPHRVGRLASPLGFGVLGPLFRELGWKTPIFPGGRSQKLQTHRATCRPRTCSSASRSVTLTNAVPQARLASCMTARAERRRFGL